MQASDKSRIGARRRRAVYSVAAVAGIAAMLDLTGHSYAGTVVFNDTFGSSTVNSGTNTPTSTSTNYDFLSTKTSAGSIIGAGDLQGKLSAATGTGAWEAQALFTLSPVTLVNAGDSIEETMVFQPTNIAAGANSTLLMGLYNSHGTAPTNQLTAAGLSNTTGSSFATGNAQLWEGYVGRFAGPTGTDQTFVRPQQTSGLTTTQNQDLLINTSGGGFFNGPAATNVTSGGAGVTLNNGSVYTDDLLLTKNADGSMSVISTLYPGTGTTGIPLASTNGLVASAGIFTFDGLAFGALNKGTSANPQLDIGSLTITTASAATLTNRTWDPGLTPGTGSDGSGNWETSSSIWAASGVDGKWVNDGTSSATFGAGGAPGTVTITVPNINSAGITFNSGYTIAANPSSTLTLTAPAVTVAAAQTATITAPIAGSVGLSSDGPGSLVLGGANTYTGNTTIANGTVVVNAGSSLGAPTNGLVIGTTGISTDTATTNTGALILNTSATVGTLTVSTNNAVANTIAINGSSVLTVNGIMTVGLSTSASSPPTTALTITGNELDVNNTMNIGLADTGATRDVTTLDMSGLSTFKMNATGVGGAFNFGAAQEAGGTVTLANTANTITTNTINISVTGNNSGVDTLNLGAGTNVVNASDILIGSGKGVGIVQFGGATGSVTIAGVTGGTSTANITIGNSTTGTAGSGNSTLNLAGHQATVQLSTLIVGQVAGASVGNPNGSATFDTGTMTIDSLQIANDSNGTAPNGVTGTFTMGGATPNNTATGVLTVTTQFSLANATNTTATLAKGNFIMNGGVANINADIVAGLGVGVGSYCITTLQIAGGTLNMTGHEIGPVSATTLAITTVTLPTTGQTATLANLGGGGINSAGLTMNGLGTLNLDGANTFAGPTAVSAGGTLAVLSTGSLPAASNVTVDGTLTLNNAAQTINSLGGSTPSAVVNLNGANLTIATSGAFPGTVQDNGTGGAPTASAALSVGSFNVGTVNANANVQINGTSKTGALKLTGGTGAWTSGVDLTSNKLILESTLSNKTSDLTRARNQVVFGKTNTDGIFTSSSLPANFAIAVMDNAVLNKPSFGGVATDSNSILVGAEMLGDANADGHVDVGDLSTVLNNFGATTAAWTSGNFDGAATIDLTDLADVLNNFGLNNANAFSSGSQFGAGSPVAAPTPEPAALSVLAIAVVQPFLRRRRRNA